jgi:putative DNA primase/helicase
MINEFLGVLRASGYEPVKPIVGDTGSKWGRLLYNGEKRDSGRYRLIIDGDRALGIYGSDKDPMGFQTWKSWEGKEVDYERHRQDEEWLAKAKKKMEREEREEYQRVEKQLTSWYVKLPEAPKDFPYLQKKEIEPEQCRYDPEDKCLVIPFFNPASRGVASVQRIYEDGSKYYHKGGAVKGNFCPLKTVGEYTEVICVSEGYATGKKVRDATGYPVFVAFDAGNLKPVCKNLRDSYPDSKIVVLADNDQFPKDNWPDNKKWVNTGVEKGRQAALEVGGIIAIPEFEESDFEKRPTDWDDFGCLYGKDALKDELSRIVNPEPSQSDASPSAEPTSQSIPDLVTEPTEEYSPIEALGRKHVTITEKNYSEHIRWKDNVAGSTLDKKFSIHNADIYLSYSPLWRGTFVYDEFEQTERIIKPLPWDDPNTFEWRDVRDVDMTQLRAVLSLREIHIASNTEMRNVMRSVASKLSIHPLREMFDRLQWDGQERLDTWLIDYCGAVSQDREYVKRVGACWMIAAAKRIYKAGTPFHHMLVLEGEQAAGKSSALRTLGTLDNRSFFTDNIGFEMIGSPYLAQFLKGRIIVEFAELSGLSMKDRNKVKAWITMEEDEMQPKFSNEIVRLPRQFVLAGSTNDSEWMNDPTGGRRFWPVKVGDLIDLKGLKEATPQLWAEAVYRAKSNEPHYIPEDDPVYKKAQAEQSARFDGHVWHDTISEFVLGKLEVSTDEILKDCLHKARERWTAKDKRDIGDVMRQLGYDSKTKHDPFLNKTVRKWVKKK